MGKSCFCGMRRTYCTYYKGDFDVMADWCVSLIAAASIRSWIVQLRLGFSHPYTEAINERRCLGGLYSSWLGPHAHDHIMAPSNGLIVQSCQTATLEVYRVLLFPCIPTVKFHTEVYKVFFFSHQSYIIVACSIECHVTEIFSHRS